MEEGAIGKEAPARSRNEIIEEMGPIKLADDSINETTAIECLGIVEKIMGSIAIVKAHTGGEYRILDEGAMVVTDARKIIGTVSGDC
jgi:hypothetical protein